MTTITILCYFEEEATRQITWEVFGHSDEEKMALTTHNGVQEMIATTIPDQAKN
jgi:hypothetical protein